MPIKESKLKYLIYFLLLAFSPACSEMSESNSSGGSIAEWVMGKWQYNDDNGKSVTVTLYPDGSAIGSDGAIGSWYYIDNTVYIPWDSGWQNIIQKNYGSGYTKKGFAPGVATSASATNTSEAIKLNGKQ